MKLTAKGFSLITVLVLFSIIAIFVGIIVLVNSIPQKQVASLAKLIKQKSNVESILASAFESKNLTKKQNFYFNLPWEKSFKINYKPYGFYGNLEIIDSENKIFAGIIGHNNLLKEITAVNCSQYKSLKIIKNTDVNGNFIGFDDVGPSVFLGKKYKGNFKANTVLQKKERYVYDKNKVQKLFDYIFKQKNFNSSHIIDGNLALNNDFLKNNIGKVFTVKGNITIKDSVFFSKPTAFFVEDSVKINSNLTGIIPLFVAKNDVVINNANVLGQFVSNSNIEVVNSKINYPSILANYTDSLKTNTINISNSNVYVSLISFSKNENSLLIITENSALNGTIISNGTSRILGNFKGCLQSKNISHYESGVTYNNYIGAKKVSCSRSDYVLPLIFKTNYEVLQNYENK